MRKKGYGMRAQGHNKAQTTKELGKCPAAMGSHIYLEKTFE